MGSATEVTLQTNEGKHIPQLAFGLYKVSKEECGNVIQNAIEAGYRHFDCAPIYGNEKEVGEGLKAVLQKGNVTRSELYICSKAGNDSVRQGKSAVRRSIETSIEDLCCDYLDIAMIHWPVPDFHLDAYKELETLVQEGKVRSIGLSNYKPRDYKDLISAQITIQPVVNQMQISAVMYRPDIIAYFADRGILVASHKSLHRGDCLDNEIIHKLSIAHSKSPAQIMIRWGVQKDLVVVCKSSLQNRMIKNRNVFDFFLTDEEMKSLDSLTKQEDVVARNEHEVKSKLS